MPDWLITMLTLVGGAVIGAITTYVASYQLEKRKWEANAALLRKDEIYSPTYDELSLKLKGLESFDTWKRIMIVRPLFNEWEKRRHKGLALMVPSVLREQFDASQKLCHQYDVAWSSLLDKLKSTFPERHLDYEDYVIAWLLAEKMLVAHSETDGIVLAYLKQQRPTSDDLATYWKTDRLAAARDKVTSLDEWSGLSKTHADYVRELTALHREMSKRIQQITEKYQSPNSRL